MIKIKKILFPLFSLFLIYRSIELVRKLIASKPNDYSNPDVLTISSLLTLFITGIFAFPGFAYATSRILPDSYYKIKKPKVLNWIYKILGVKYFTALLLIAFWGRKKNRKKYFDGTRKGLQNFIYQTKQSEFGHMSAFLVILVISIFLLGHGYFYLSIIVSLINIIGNLYPIILQRFHRMRIEKLTMYKNPKKN